MANPERGEVDFDFNGRRYVLKFSNAGKRVAERELNMSSPEITLKLFQTPGNDIITVLFFGATRKFHSRDFPVLQAVDSLMDDIEDTDFANGNTDIMLDLIHSIRAAFIRRPKEEVKKLFAGESAPDGEPGEPGEEEDEEPGKGTSDTEPAGPQRQRKKKEKIPLSEVGGSS